MAKPKKIVPTYAASEQQLAQSSLPVGSVWLPHASWVSPVAPLSLSAFLNLPRGCFDAKAMDLSQLKLSLVVEKNHGRH